MDVWGTINVGKRRTEDDGTQHDEVACTTDWQVTVIGQIGPDQLALALPEVPRQVKHQLRIMLNDMIYTGLDHAEKGSA